MSNKNWVIDVIKDYFEPCRHWWFWVVIIITTIVLSYYDIRLGVWIGGYHE